MHQRSVLILSVVCLFVLVGCQSLNAQKFIRLDKSGTLKTQKFYLGEVLTFKMRGEDYWLTEEILDIHPQDGYILFENRVVSAANIEKIRLYFGQSFSKGARISLTVFGLSWATYALAGSLFEYELQTRDAVVPLTSLALGQLLHMLFKQKTHKLGKRKRLVLVDMDVSPIFKTSLQRGP